MSAIGDTLGVRRRLDSWKEIALFFGRDERTVKRWEKERGLPVYRVPGSARGGVFAYVDELNGWLQGTAVEEPTPAVETESSKTPAWESSSVLPFSKTDDKLSLSSGNGSVGSKSRLPMWAVIPLAVGAVVALVCMHRLDPQAPSYDGCESQQYRQPCSKL